MAAFPQRRISGMAEWARRVSAFSLVLFVTAGVGHRYGLVESYAFLWTLALVAALALGGLVLAAGGFVELWRHGAKAGKASLAAALLSLFVLVPYGAAGWLYLTLPALTDISTDVEEPPPFTIAPRFRTPQMNALGGPITREAAATQLRHYPEVAGRRLDAPVERVLAALAPVVAARGWQVRGRLPTSASGPEILIEMEAPSFLMRFPADAVLRLTDEDETTFVDIRMATRYGPHDLGANARRITAFMADLAAELERQSLEIIDIPAASEGGVDRVD